MRPDKRYWVSQITEGAVELGAAALAIANGATGTDANELLNKIAVALDFTIRTASAGLGVTPPLPAAFAAAAVAVLSKVDGISVNDASVTAGEDATSAYISGATAGHQAVLTASKVDDPNVIAIADQQNSIDPRTSRLGMRFLAVANATVNADPFSYEQAKSSLDFSASSPTPNDMAAVGAGTNAPPRFDPMLWSGGSPVVSRGQGHDTFVSMIANGNRLAGLS